MPNIENYIGLSSRSSEFKACQEKYDLHLSLVVAIFHCVDM